jgi:hypothetical protein
MALTGEQPSMDDTAAIGGAADQLRHGPGRNPAVQHRCDVLSFGAETWSREGSAHSWIDTAEQVVDVRRREFITLLGSAATVWPRPGFSQPGRKSVPRIGVLLFGTPETAEFRRVSRRPA